RLDDRLRQAGPAADVLYFASPGAVRSLALGFQGLLADIYWMRAVQYYGRRDEAERRKVRYGNLATLLDIATTLDPDRIQAYRFGATFLWEPEPVGAGQPAEALRLLDKGIERHPADWRLWFDKGFVYFWTLRDYRKAGDVWVATARLPGAPRWIESVA